MDTPAVPESLSQEASIKDAPANVETVSVDAFPPVNEARLIRKIDLNLLPILTLLYLLSFLDRSNIGNAKLDGLTTDINVIGANYNTSLAIYFVGYVIWEVPCNMVLKRLNPRIWLPTLTLLWGIVSVTQGLVSNQVGLFSVRFFLGMTEAGLFPGSIFVFSMYYPRRVRHYRVAIFFGGAAVSGAFGGALAYAIGLMDGVGGRRGWSWIFILEGCLTVFVSLCAYFIVPTWPRSATFLTEAERGYLLTMLSRDSDAADLEPFNWDGVKQALGDHAVWGYALLFHGFAFVLYSISLFMPTIIANLGFATWEAQLMTVPPYALAATCIWLACYASYKADIRAPFIIGAAGVAFIGYILLVSTSTAGPQYLGVHLSTAGVYTGNALLLSWPAENVSSQTKRAVAVALQISIGDLGAIVGVLVYRPDLAGNLYRTPHIVAMAYLVFGSLVAGWLWFWLNKENLRREKVLSEKGEKQEAQEGNDGLEERRRFGDRDVRWKYQL
ncbi:MFS general substrate transporter [Dacryopinax primogenitus]|uniref:MFS general substrate transporter n=1 Tax=Dacryopinax primogenitus (strain DJM 731) TaxID=1858805 RepID=M5G4U6_DACPD|nr:MFS general substrate transporter [Dacryopinax primogenitus]EJU03245.1 MFS general substrate transporter [Dacryopinax primogenitus]